MRRLLLTLALCVAAPLQAQGPYIVALHTDLFQVQQKLIGLANTIPEAAYGWRPAPGVRSIGEVFLHVASENYQIPVFMGADAPAETGITADFATVDKWLAKPRTKAQVVADLEASFKHAHSALHVITDDNLNEKIKMFGQEFTRANAAMLFVTHIHEHLGQMIAYARSNNIVPPWSK
jgi:uncharacterized damage-inducible protein DinB